MALATGAQSELAYVMESTYGTTPGTPALKLLPVTGFNLRPNLEFIESKDLVSDRQVRSNVKTFESGLLDFDYELKHADFDDWLQMALFGTWSTNVLKGGNTRSFCTAEANHNDVTQFPICTGVMVNSMSMSLTPGQIATGKFSCLTQDYNLNQTSADADGYTAATGNTSMATVNGALTINGETGIFTGLELSLENGLEPARTLMNGGVLTDIFDGRQRVTGTVSAYFQDETQIDALLAETSFSISVQLQDPASNTVTILLPNCKYTGGDFPVDGESGIVHSLPVQALYDNTEATSIKITRSA